MKPIDWKGEVLEYGEDDNNFDNLEADMSGSHNKVKKRKEDSTGGKSGAVKKAKL